MTERRRAILIVVIAGLLLVGIIAAVLLFRKAPPETRLPAPGPSADLTPEQQAAAVVIGNPLAPRDAAVVGRTAAAQMAELFAERFGSYSNQGDYQNLRDLLPVMTPAYRAETEEFLSTAAPQQGQTFEGVTSAKVSTDVRAFDAAAGTAVVAVTLQQEKVSGTSTVVGYRALRMELRRIGEEWRVDASRWENDLTPA